MHSLVGSKTRLLLNTSEHFWSAKCTGMLSTKQFTYKSKQKKSLATSTQKQNEKSVKTAKKKRNSETEIDYHNTLRRKAVEKFKKNAYCRQRNSCWGKTVEELVKTNTFVKNVQHIKGLNHPVVTANHRHQKVLLQTRTWCCKPGGFELGKDKIVWLTFMWHRQLIKNWRFWNVQLWTFRFVLDLHSFIQSQPQKPTANRRQRIRCKNPKWTYAAANKCMVFKIANKACLQGLTHVLCISPFRKKS